nr:hypothetical protein OG409_35280 [Streptomyces sp. NBC_00974]
MTRDDLTDAASTESAPGAARTAGPCGGRPAPLRALFGILAPAPAPACARPGRVWPELASGG